MHVPKKAAAAAAVLAIGAGAFLASTAGANDKPTRPEGGVVKEVNVSKPGEVNAHAIWRNGQYHIVKVKVTHKVKTYKNGFKEEEVSENEADIAEATKGIPAVDPALNNDANGNPKRPTPAQEAESNAALGTPDAFPAGLPAGASSGVIPRRASDPPLGP